MSPDFQKAMRRIFGNRERSRIHTAGIRLMLRAAFTFSLMALCVKALSPRLPSMEIVFFRSLTGLMLIAGLMVQKRVSFTGRCRFRMILRGLSGFAALGLFFHAISRLPLGTAVFLNYTSPFFVFLFSRLWLRESFGFLFLFLLTVCFSGVYLLVEGSIPAWNIHVAAGLLSAVFAALAYVLIRSIRHRESPLTIIFYFTLISTAGSFALMLDDFRWPSFRDWLLLGGVGFFAFFAQLWLTIALRRAPASLVSPFSYLTPLLSYGYGILFWADPLTGKGLTGAVLIITGGTLLSHIGTLKRPAE